MTAVIFRESDLKSHAIFYDAACNVCCLGRRYCRHVVKRRGFEIFPLQTPGIAEQFNLSPGEIPSEMKVRTAAGQWLGGVDAYLFVFQSIWWTWPLYAIARVPGVKCAYQCVCKFFADRRYVISRCCVKASRVCCHEGSD